MSHRTCSFPGCGDKHLARDLCTRHYSQWRAHGTVSELKPRFTSSLDPRDVVRHFSVEVPTGCWEWTGHIASSGYGNVLYRGKRWVGSRLSYSAFHGPIPEGLVVCHRCDNPPCVNPAHLFVGTMGENTRDSMQKDRFARGENRPQAKLTDADCARIREMRAEGMSYGQIAVHFPHVSEGHLCKVARGHRRAMPTNSNRVAA